MKPKTLLIALAALSNYGAIQAQNMIEFPYGSTPVIDGDFSNTEWQDADTLTIQFSGNTVTVYYMHDSVNMHIAYVNNLQSVSRMPEVMFDVNNSKSGVWEADDWWFHVSATDCEYQGQHGNYDSCMAVRPNWTAEPNMASGPPSPPYVDTIEVQIPFATIGYDINSGDTIGLSFEVTNLFSAWNHWPTSATLNDPSSWGSAVFSGPTSTQTPNADEDNGYLLFPNPAQEELRIILPEPIENGNLVIFDLTGRPVKNQSVSAIDSFRLDISELPSSQYLVQLQSEEEIQTFRFIKN